MNLSMQAIALAAAATLLTACASGGRGGPPPRPVTLQETVTVEFGPNASNEICAVNVLPEQSDCPPGLAGPQTVCRAPGDGGGTMGKAVKWVRANPNDPEFEIDFKFKKGSTQERLTPCTGQSPRHECIIKDNDQIRLPNREGATRVYKYDVNVTGCSTPLDPYIIIMR